MFKNHYLARLYCDRLEHELRKVTRQRDEGLFGLFNLLCLVNQATFQLMPSFKDSWRIYGSQCATNLKVTTTIEHNVQITLFSVANQQAAQYEIDIRTLTRERDEGSHALLFCFHPDRLSMCCPKPYMTGPGLLHIIQILLRECYLTVLNGCNRIPM